MDEIQKNFWNKYGTIKLNKLMNSLKDNKFNGNNEDEKYFLKAIEKIKILDPTYCDTLLKVYTMIKRRESIVAVILLFSILFPQYLPIAAKMKKLMLIGG